MSAGDTRNVPTTRIRGFLERKPGKELLTEFVFDELGGIFFLGRYAEVYSKVLTRL